MVASRRSVGIHETSSWVFNRMVDVYDARPPYPLAVVDHLADLAGAPGGAVGDLGAGTGHLALPLAARGFDVVAVEPARAMLDRLSATAASRGLAVRAVHACAEALPLEPASLRLAVVADALHFVDAELSARELRRVLGPRAALAVVRCDFGDTPFMRGVVEAMESAAPRRPRNMDQAVVQVFADSGVRLEQELRFDDETPVDDETLERVLRSISYIGPAMNRARFAAFHAAIRRLRGPSVWARTITVQSGRRPR